MRAALCFWVPLAALDLMVAAQDDVANWRRVCCVVAASLCMLCAHRAVTRG